MRITVDLAKASTEPIDLTKILNPRVGDGDLKLPFHIIYDQADYDMRGKSMDFLSEGSDQKKIYVSGTTDESSTGDDAYTGNVTFTFPTGTFKTAGTYDVDKTMFRIVDNEGNVISSVNVKMTVLPNDADVASTADLSYDSRAEKVIDDFKQKGQSSLDDAKKQAQQLIDDAKQQATDYLNDTKKQGDALLDEIKQTNAEAKGNVSGDTAATATQAKQQAIDNSGKIHDLQGEVGDARGRFMTLSDRENNQDFNIERKEDKDNANANYAAQDLRNDQQDKEIAKKANQSFITDYLSRMYMEPEAFTNETALKAKYPDGNPGIMVTVDTGHKWVWDNNQWNDCGVYQGVGIADRSISSQHIKERSLTLRTSQNGPWIVDLANGNITVTENSAIYDDGIYEIPKGKYEIQQEELNYLGYDPERKKIDRYDIYMDIPESSFFIGFIDNKYTHKVFLQFDWIESTKIPANNASEAVKIDRENLPAPASGLISLLPWKVDLYSDSPSITVYGFASYYAKNTAFAIASGTYKLDKIDSGAYYLYLDLNYADFTAEIKATDKLDKISPFNPWIGFIETNYKSFRIFNNSNNLSYNYSLVTPSKFTVDFDEGILYVPVFWQTVNPLKLWGSNDSIAAIKFDTSKGALFVGIDTSKSDVNEMIVLDSDKFKIQNNYQYIGWISINTREFDFGDYGSTHDLASEPWINKQVACLGDSITEGDSGEGGLIDSYVPKLKKYVGVMPLNYGKSGALITKKTDDDISFVNRVGAIKNMDVVTIFGGINDFQWNAPLGTMSDGPDKPTTFYGALKYVITTLSTNNPNAKLLLITPMKTTKFQYHTFDENGNLMKNANNNTQLDFVNAIKEVADYYSIPVLDMYSCSNYSPYLPSQVGHDNFTADGLHPTARGYERIAQTIGHAINAL